MPAPEKPMRRPAAIYLVDAPFFLCRVTYDIDDKVCETEGRLDYLLGRTKEHCEEYFRQKKWNHRIMRAL